MRFRNEGFETSGKDNQYGILQKNLKIIFGGNDKHRFDLN